MIKKLLLSVLLIGFLFNVFHDFIFYKIDPCMKTVESLKSSYDTVSKNDPLCKIHKNLHFKYIFSEKIDFNNVYSSDKVYFTVSNLTPKDIPDEIFKPPTLI